MKTMQLSQLRFVILAALLFGVIATVDAKPEKKVVTFSVEMHCENCKKKIERNLAYEKGVLDLDTNLKKKTVTVSYDATQTDVKKLKDALKKLGYDAAVLPASAKRPATPL